MKFRCITAHLLPGDQYVEPGTIIGDGTRYPVDFDFYPPTADMEALDDEGKPHIERAIENMRTHDPIDTLDIGGTGASKPKPPEDKSVNAPPKNDNLDKAKLDTPATGVYQSESPPSPKTFDLTRKDNA